MCDACSLCSWLPLFFLHEPVTTLGIFGVVLATAGAVAYSLAKRMLQNDTPWTWNHKQPGLLVIMAVVLGLILLTYSIMTPGALSAPNMQMARDPNAVYDEPVVIRLDVLAYTQKARSCAAVRKYAAHH